MSSRYMLVLLAVSILTGCASLPIGMHHPNMATVLSLRQFDMTPTSVGDFKPAATLEAGRDRSVALLKSPLANSFSAYLKDALIRDLRSAGKYDAEASVAISGQLAQNDLAVSASKSRSTLAARFVVTRNGENIYKKLISVDHQWSSEFLGPENVNQYTLMYARLLNKLFADEEFKKAVAANAVDRSVRS